MSPRVLFEQELERLKGKVTEMGNYAQISYDALFEAVKNNDYETVKMLQDNDRKMMDMQRSIEADCLILMTKQQPVAKDLRLVSAALKVVTDIERIGDHVADMAELFMRRNGVFLKESCDETLVCMFVEAGRMLIKSIEAFMTEDMQTAQEVIDSDDVVDAYFNCVKEELTDAIRGQSPDADRLVDNLMLAKYLEKVGDHAVNIGEWAIFRITGDIEGIALY